MRLLTIIRGGLTKMFGQLMRLLTIIRGELTKMFRQRGIYAGYILLAIFIGLFVWGVWAGGPPMGDASRQFGDDMAVGGNLISGPLVPYLLLEIPIAVNVFIPLLVSMVAGGIIAGEARSGTLRMLLTRPVHRWMVATGKTIAAFIHATTLVAFLGAFSLLVGIIVFGRGDIITVRGGLRIFAEPQALQRLGIAYGVTALTMCAVAAIAVFCSAIFARSLTASGVTICFLIVSGALMVIPYFEWLKPYLLTTHFNAFTHVFEKTIDWPEIRIDLIYIADYTAAAIAGTLVVFCRRNMTC